MAPVVSDPAWQVTIEEASRVELVVEDRDWDFAAANRQEVQRYFERRQAENPAFFNGSFYVCSHWSIDGGVFRGRLLRSDFASFLYWRYRGYLDESVKMCFGSPAIVSSDQHLLTVVMSDDTVSPGLTKFPTGSIDDSDVENHAVDLTANMTREVREETGLDLSDATPGAGWSIVFDGPWISATRAYRLPVTSAALEASVRDHLARDPSPELKDIHFIRGLADIIDDGMPGFVKSYLRRQFS